MVGVQNVHKCSKRSMEWLEGNGRHFLYRKIKEFNKKCDYGDFSFYIICPTDIQIHHQRKKALVSTVWIFSKSERKKADKFLRHLLRGCRRGDTVWETQGKEDWGLKSNEYLIDITWHGDKAYFDGWDFVLSSIPPEIFRKEL